MALLPEHVSGLADGRWTRCGRRGGGENVGGGERSCVDVESQRVKNRYRPTEHVTVVGSPDVVFPVGRPSERLSSAESGRGERERERGRERE